MQERAAVGAEDKTMEEGMKAESRKEYNGKGEGKNTRQKRDRLSARTRNLVRKGY